MSKSETTPLRQQYLDLKAQYPDTILFFRLGDFYETFDEDAEIASRELDIVLTSRPVSKDARVPMAGVPHHAVDGYIARLIEKGYRVALAEQVGEPTGNGPMERRVERVVTAGTLTEPAMLDEKRPNYLAAVVTEGERGVAYAEISTGEFATTQFAGESAQDVLGLVRQSWPGSIRARCWCPRWVRGKRHRRIGRCREMFSVRRAILHIVCRHASRRGRAIVSRNRQRGRGC